MNRFVTKPPFVRYVSRYHDITDFLEDVHVKRLAKAFVADDDPPLKFSIPRVGRFNATCSTHEHYLLEYNTEEPAASYQTIRCRLWEATGGASCFLAQASNLEPAIYFDFKNSLIFPEYYQLLHGQVRSDYLSTPDGKRSKTSLRCGSCGGAPHEGVAGCMSSLPQQGQRECQVLSSS